MTNVGTQLYELQQIDLQLRQNSKRLKEIANELANHIPVQRAQKQVAVAEGKLKPLQTDLRDLELQVQTTRQKREGSEGRLYSGSVSNPKELQDIEQNIASLKRRQVELEDRQLELMMAVESAQETLHSAEENLSAVISEAAASNQGLLSEKETLESDSKTLKVDRAELVSQMDENDVQLYEDLKSKMAGRPIAILTDEQTCSICGVRQTSMHSQTIRQSNDLQTCASCNRILIVL